LRNGRLDRRKECFGNRLVAGWHDVQTIRAVVFRLVAQELRVHVDDDATFAGDLALDLRVQQINCGGQQAAIAHGELAHVRTRWTYRRNEDVGHTRVPGHPHHAAERADRELDFGSAVQRQCRTDIDFFTPVEEVVVAIQDGDGARAMQRELASETIAKGLFGTFAGPAAVDDREGLTRERRLQHSLQLGRVRIRRIDERQPELLGQPVLPRRHAVANGEVFRDADRESLHRHVEVA
jgi:hypothetical protein